MIAVGAAVVPLGIASPVPMSGFAARNAPSLGEHDPLTARALALEEVVLITVDVCALEESTCEEISRSVHPERPERVITTATHTHAGPCSTPTRLTRCSPEILRVITRAAVAAGAAARAARRPCTMEHRSAHEVGVASNRRHPERPVDPPVQMLRFSDATSGEVAVSLLTYPCHPVVLDGTNRLLSGDYVHPLRERIEAEHPGSIAVFATGCAGDFNTGHSAEASFSLEGSSSRTFSEARRVGTEIAEAALAAARAEAAGPVGGPIPSVDEVHCAGVPVTLAVDRPCAEQVAVHTAAWSSELVTAAPGRAALLSLWLDWADAVPEGSTWTGRVSVVRLGTVTIVALPGEPFWQIAEEIRDRIDGPCLVLGYADGCPGYIPTAEEIPLGGYEVEDAHRYYGMPGPFAAGSDQILIDKAVTAWREAG
ncbi:alkaline ceramidase [Brachybacterium sp. YJGR34]|uniref:alkaline ceramidase n=1 Tax=Brachybacterium sp. YJGR34 TaxID=2059911 RepID=UPI000E0C72E8|nr:alkaline ceramidase [Brachybacterium sp. YJGR34]